MSLKKTLQYLVLGSAVVLLNTASAQAGLGDFFDKVNSFVGGVGNVANSAAKQVGNMAVTGSKAGGAVIQNLGMSAVGVAGAAGRTAISNAIGGLGQVVHGGMGIMQGGGGMMGGGGGMMGGGGGMAPQGYAQQGYPQEQMAPEQQGYPQEQMAPEQQGYPQQQTVPAA